MPKNNDKQFRLKIEKDKRANELIRASEELRVQSKNKHKLADKLVLASTELAFQSEVNDKLADKLILASTELAFQSKENDKLSDELVLANTELVFQNEKNDELEDELVLANTKLAFQNQEKDKLSDQLVIVNEELAVQNKLDGYRTERVRVAKELTVFIDTANAPIFGVDVDGNVNQWNQKSAEITGYPFDEVSGKNLVEVLITPAYRESVNQVFKKALKGDETGSFEFLFYTKDNSLVMILLNVTTRRDASGAVIGVVGLGQDITELDSYRSEMEAKVKERTHELDTILTLSPNGFVLANADNNIVYINPALLNMMGLQASKFIGKSSAVFSDAMSSLYNLELMENTSLIGEEDSERSLVLSYPIARILCCNIKTIYGVTGEKEGQVLYFRDITHETEVDKIKSEFLSTAAHELRTPLASIYGFSELLMTREYDENTSNEIFETIHRQSLNLKRLLDELLDLSRIEAMAGKDFNLQKQSLKELLKQSCAEAEGAFNGRKIEIKSSEYWPLLSFDIDKMRQVFNNLLSNAFKYSPESENVTLKTSQRKKNGSAQFGISIVDNGIGMDPQQLSRIGERFYRANESGLIPGTGLGLSLVKEIVATHGGDIEFISAKNQGMKVTIWLPIKH
jgi:PAS domain S-box-containing protein